MGLFTALTIKIFEFRILKMADSRNLKKTLKCQIFYNPTWRHIGFSKPGLKLKFIKFIADSRHLENIKYRNISATISSTFTKCGFFNRPPLQICFRNV